MLHSFLLTEIMSHEAHIKTVCSTGETMTTEGHYGTVDIKTDSHAQFWQVETKKAWPGSTTNIKGCPESSVVSQWCSVLYYVLCRIHPSKLMLLFSVSLSLWKVLLMSIFLTLRVPQQQQFLLQLQQLSKCLLHLLWYLQHLRSLWWRHCTAIRARRLERWPWRKETCSF